ncbi:hypothetical protein GI582_24390 [Sulfitobacter sp. BDSS02]|uniref:hypothetical protein n=1 Tax=Heliomarina sp. TaxID=2917556 RepID=UPI004057FED1|nr:hypothetical protein [Sulfitobacter sp. BDSS02]MBR9852435.1 hypothetical protein [Paracoccaceae bacterium]
MTACQITSGLLWKNVKEWGLVMAGDYETAQSLHRIPSDTARYRHTPDEARQPKLARNKNTPYYLFSHQKPCFVNGR